VPSFIATGTGPSAMTSPNGRKASAVKGSMAMGMRRLQLAVDGEHAWPRRYGKYPLEYRSAYVNYKLDVY
jgi:hypothetical protein